MKKINMSSVTVILVWLLTVAILVLVSMLVTGCADDVPFVSAPAGVAGPQGPAGPQGLPGVSALIPTAVQSLVDVYNDYRSSQGQEPVVPGLTCTLYTIPTNTTCLSTTTGGATCTPPSSAGYASIGSFTYASVFNQPNLAGTSGFNILPAELQPEYSQWFRVTCTGLLFVTDDNYHTFTLSSDDGSNLYISGLVVNNDGVHSSNTVSGTKYLDNLQPYSFELDYFQGPGNVQLILQEDGGIMGAGGFYH
jgi:hypothetical protein